MTGQCSELILLIWSVWSGYRAIRVLYLPSSPIPSSLSQYWVSPSLSLTINNITTSDNHTASYRTSHTIASSHKPYRLLLTYFSLHTLISLFCIHSKRQWLISNIYLFRYFAAISAEISSRAKNKTVLWNMEYVLQCKISLYYWSNFNV